MKLRRNLSRLAGDVLVGVMFIAGAAVTAIIFDLAVDGGRSVYADDALPNAKTGKKLPPGGGEAGAAYLVYIKAVNKKDVAAFRKMHKSTEGMSDADLRERLNYFITYLCPPDATVTGGYAAGNRVALYVEGTLEKVKQYGVVELVKNKDGVWQVGMEGWDKTPGEQ